MVRTEERWDEESGHEVSCLVAHEGVVTSIAWSPDGHKLASASLDGTVRVWDTATWREAACLPAPTQSLRTVGFLLDGRHVVAQTWAGELHIWDAVRVARLGVYQDEAMFQALTRRLEAIGSRVIKPQILS